MKVDLDHYVLVAEGMERGNLPGAVRDGEAFDAFGVLPRDRVRDTRDQGKRRGDLPDPFPEIITIRPVLVQRPDQFRFYRSERGGYDNTGMFVYRYNEFKRENIKQP